MAHLQRGLARALLRTAFVCVLTSGGTATDRPQLAPPALRSGIVINIPQRLLFFMADGAVVAGYPVGLGRPDWPTFVGAFTIASKEVDPVWDVPVTIQEELRRAGKPVVTRMLPGPANPLGKYWLGLSVAGYGIHGTNAPASISRVQTHGCIRMLASDIEDLFARVEVGTPGAIIYEPIVMGNIDGVLWMEAHPDIYRRDRRDLLGYVRIEAARLNPRASLDLEVVKRLLKERSGRPERIDATTG
jgi:L,D-transpeptidase ErfK/SrfK